MLAVLCIACGAGDRTATDISFCESELFVSPPSATLHVGDSLQATAKTGCAVQHVLVIRWRSSDTSVAAVDAQSGLIRARSPGTASIVASLVADTVEKGAMGLQTIQ
jgi:uncharacterized protein YjdB